MTGDIKTTFLSTNELEVTGNVNATSINYQSKEELKTDLNKP